ncbi:MAG: GGDEF domain-containing protein [Dorea sp.]|nr:GGDEF domain-containing protein [Dorea sp.]
MNDKNYEILYEYLKGIRSGPEVPSLDINELDENYRDFGHELLQTGEELIAYKKREQQFEEEKQRIQNRADMIEGYNELLVAMLSKRDEWLLVVDMESKEILYCNKRKQFGRSDNHFCKTCKNRLTFHPELLSWKGDEQYSVWEMSGEDGANYRITSFPIELKERSSYVHIIVDITEEKRMAHNLTSKAYHDPGTGIKNRLFFEEYMEIILRDKQQATLCYLDLDGLKYVNDKYGHLEGDMYIQNFVEIIRKDFRSGDTFARIGGDEFCLVLTGNMKELLDRKLEEILTEFQESDFSEYQCSFSFGVVDIPGAANTMTLDEILQKADALMYECKRKNKERFPELVR